MKKEELIRKGMIEKETLKIIEILEKKYPNHTFDWQLKAGRFWALCPNPQHNDTHPANFNVYQGEDGKWHWKCFVCGISGPKKSDLDPIEGDIDILKNDLRRQIRERRDLGFDYLAGRLDYITEERTQKLLFNVFEVGYHFYEPKFASDFSRVFKDSVPKSPILWERSNHEWLVFPYRNLHDGTIDRLKFRNIWVEKGTPEWDAVGQKTIIIEREDEKENKKKGNAIPVFGYENLHAKSPLLFLVEGEFDAITTTIASNGLYAAVALGGTGNFKKETIEQIAKKAKGKAIIILPDWDAAGREALYGLIDDLNDEFLENNKLFTILKPPAENVKDIDEYLRDKYNGVDDAMADLLENVVPLSEFKKEWEKEKEKEREKVFEQYPPEVQKLLGVSANVIKRQNIGQILSTDFPETVNTFDIFYEGVNLLVSRGGIGKSFIMLFAAIDYAFKQRKKVLFISFEDYVNQKFKEDRVKKGIEYYADFIAINKKEVEQVISDYVDIDFGYENIFDKDRRGNLIETEYLNVFKEDLKRYDFIIIDPFLSFIGIDELDSSLIRKALLKIRQLLINEGKQKIIVFTHHTNKNLKVFSELSNKSKLTFEDYNDLIEMVRGTMETTNVIRNVVFALGYPTAKNVRRLVIIKSNIAEVGKTKEVITPWALADQYASEENKTKSKKVYNFGGSVS